MRPVVRACVRDGLQGERALGREHTEQEHKGICQLAWCVWSSYSSLVPVPKSREWEAARRFRRGVEGWAGRMGSGGRPRRWRCQVGAGALGGRGDPGRAGRWLTASLCAPHRGVDGRAGGKRDVQDGEQGAHVHGVGVPDEYLTEDRGFRGKQGALSGGGGVAARRGRMSTARDKGENTT